MGSVGAVTANARARGHPALRRPCPRALSAAGIWGRGATASCCPGPALQSCPPAHLTAPQHPRRNGPGQPSCPRFPALSTLNQDTELSCFRWRASALVPPRCSPQEGQSGVGGLAQLPLLTQLRRPGLAAQGSDGASWEHALSSQPSLLSLPGPLRLSSSPS